jgi:hypothetical protein
MPEDDFNRASSRMAKWRAVETVLRHSEVVLRRLKTKHDLKSL